MYYRLHEHCHLVTGARRGAIYDLRAQKVYSINASAVNLLNRSRRAPIEEALTTPDSDPKTLHLERQFLDDLTKKNLGGYYFFPAAAPQQPASYAEPPLSLDFAWLEITQQCNNRCLHCYNASSPEHAAQTLSLKTWLQTIDSIKAAGATGLQFIGGEPLLYPHWRTLTAKARQQGFEFIEIFTNATTITDDDIRFFLQEQIYIATTLYADTAEIHDKITQNQGSFQKTVDAVRKMVACRIPVRIASILMKANEHLAQKIPAFCVSLGVEGQPPDVVRPTGRGAEPDLAPKSYCRPPIAPPFFTDEPEFFLAKAYNPCLAGKIAIAANGDVLPCIFARNQSFGNICEQSLSDVLASKGLLNCWRTNKDKIEKCRECEYRYACPDCRIAAQAADPAHRFTAATPDCSYNPHTGEWA